LKSFLKRKFASLDADEMIRLYESDNAKALPRWPYEYEGWKVEFRPIPKKPSARGKESDSAIGMRTTGWFSQDSSIAIKNAITDKASRYGKLDHPYVIAIDDTQIAVDDVSISEALFGKEEWLLSPEELPTMRRKRDGAWFGPHGPHNKRVSAILYVRKAHAWGFPSAAIRLFHNPWAEKPYKSTLCDLPQAIPKDGRMELVEGKFLSEIFALPPGWPEV
jgi:hypothetical protein